MSKVSQATGIDRAARLTPFDAGRLVGRGVYVLSGADAIPGRGHARELQRLQAARREAYLAEGGTRTSGPQDAPVYVVSYRDMVIAWVSMDGRTHYASELSHPGYGTGGFPTRERAFERAWALQAELQRMWPATFRLSRDGHPSAYARTVPAVPADACPQCDRTDDCECAHVMA